MEVAVGLTVMYLIGHSLGWTSVLTGVTTGIGRAVAIAFARQGADLLLSYLPNEEQDGAETTKWVTEAGKRAVQMPGTCGILLIANA